MARQQRASRTQLLKGFGDTLSLRRPVLREEFYKQGVKPRIPGRKSCTQPVKYDKRQHKRRNRI